METQLPSLKGAQPRIFGPCMLLRNGCMDQDLTWYRARPRPRRLCVRWGPRLPFPKRGPSPQIFGPCLLWPNGWIDQNDTWHGGRPQPRRVCIRWRPNPSPKGGGAPSPIFGSFLLWPNGWMHQDATWYGCRPQPRGRCVRWEPIPPPQKGAEPSPKFSAHVYCGQTAAWIKVPLGMKVRLNLGDSVLDGDPASSPQRGWSLLPIFGLFLLWPNGWMHQDATWYRGRPQPRELCVRWGPSPLPKKGAKPPIFGPCLLGPNGRMDQDGT